MIEINGKVFRNLEDQVAYLSEALQAGKLIDELGIKVLGVYSTIEQAKAAIPGPYDYGDAFSIGTTKPYDLYIFTRNIEDFVNFGSFPGKGKDGKDGEQGPKGEKGDQGERGPRGERGFQGPVGEQGPRGFEGKIGPQGAQGPKGDVGPAFNVKATLASTSQLPTPTATLQAKGTAYLIPNEAGVKHIWVIQGEDSSSLAWTDIGPSGVQGPQGAPGKGIDSLTDLNLTLGETTVQYDTTNGISIASTGRTTYQEGQTDFATDLQLPIIAGDGISIDKDAAAEKVVINNTGMPKAIELTSNLQLSGKLPADQLAIVSQRNPKDYILWKGEIYYLNDAVQTSDYVVYENINYANNKPSFKRLTVTLSTGNWQIIEDDILNKATADKLYYKSLGAGGSIRVPVTHTDGSTGSYDLATTAITAWFYTHTLPWYFSKDDTIVAPHGQDQVQGYLISNTPLQDYHVANKKYVDEKFIDQVGVHTHYIYVKCQVEGVDYSGSGLYVGPEPDPFTLEGLYDQRRAINIYNTSLTGGLEKNILFNLVMVGYSSNFTQGMASVNIYDLDNHVSIYKAGIVPTAFRDTVIQ